MQNAAWKGMWRFWDYDMHGTMFAPHVVKICFNITDGNVVEVNADKKIVLYTLSKKTNCFYEPASGCTFFFSFFTELSFVESLLQ